MSTFQKSNPYIIKKEAVLLKTASLLSITYIYSMILQAVDVFYQPGFKVGSLILMDHMPPCKLIQHGKNLG
jgi:hypothetical protein